MDDKDKDEIIKYSAAMSELAAERGYHLKILAIVSIVISSISLLVQLLQ